MSQPEPKPITVPEVLPVEAQVRTQDLEADDAKDDSLDEEDATPGKDENAPGFLKPTDRRD